MLRPLSHILQIRFHQYIEYDGSIVEIDDGCRPCGLDLPMFCIGLVGNRWVFLKDTHSNEHLLVCVAVVREIMNLRSQSHGLDCVPKKTNTDIYYFCTSR